MVIMSMILQLAAVIVTLRSIKSVEKQERVEYIKHYSVYDFDHLDSFQQVLKDMNSTVW